MSRLITSLVLFALAARLPAQMEEGTATQVQFMTQQVERGVAMSDAAVVGWLEAKRDHWQGTLGLTQPWSGSAPTAGRVKGDFIWPQDDSLHWRTGIAASWRERTIPDMARQTLEGEVAVVWQGFRGWRLEGAASYEWETRIHGLVVKVTRELPLVRWGTFLVLDAEAGWRKGEDLRPEAPTPSSTDMDSYRHVGVSARVPYRVGLHTTLEMSAGGAISWGQSRLWSPLGRRATDLAWAGFAVRFDF